MLTNASWVDAWVVHFDLDMGGVNDLDISVMIDRDMAVYCMTFTGVRRMTLRLVPLQRRRYWRIDLDLAL